MNTLKVILRFTYAAYAIFTLGLITMTFFGFNSFWLTGFLGLALPVIMLSHIPVFMLYLLYDIRKIGWSLSVLVCSLVLLPRTYAFNRQEDPTAISDIQKVRLMNYNVRNMNAGASNDLEKDEIRDWLINAPADIMILPEYFSNTHKRFQINRLLQDKGFTFYHVLEHEKSLKTGHFHGIAVFSRYPIVAVRDTLFEDVNGIIRADIKVKDDTLTIIGVHLYSMTLQLDELLKQRKKSGLTKESKESYYKIKNGFIGRKRETDLLTTWIRDARHAVIVSGDFNETPYSYSYSQTRRLLANAFEDKGEGFGFTFNGTPRFIRIDNQFYDNKAMELISFKTRRDVKYSDHYPLIGEYAIKKADRK